MKLISGHKYSKEKFDGYEMWLKTEIIAANNNIYHVDVYTTQTDIQKVKNDISSIKTDKAKSIDIINHAPKEQMELLNKFLDEWLK